MMKVSMKPNPEMQGGPLSAKVTLANGVVSAAYGGAIAGLLMLGLEFIDHTQFPIALREFGTYVGLTFVGLVIGLIKPPTRAPSFWTVIAAAILIPFMFTVFEGDLVQPWVTAVGVFLAVLTVLSGLTIGRHFGFVMPTLDDPEENSPDTHQ
jgi:hypothetical protein